MTRPAGITADSLEGRMLLALRAGPHTYSELRARLGHAANVAPWLARAGLAIKAGDDDGGTWSITDAGRAACPFRNPLAAKVAATPEVFTMPKGETKLPRQKVLAAIVAAGAPGISRQALIAKFQHQATEQSIDQHISALNRQTPPVIYKPKPGLLVGIQFGGQAPAAIRVEPPIPTPVPEIAPETPSTATDDWVPEPLATDPPTGAAALVQKLGRFPTIVEDINLDDPETVEFAIYSSGGLDIYCEDCAITLRAPVLDKLRAFLGLFAEAA